MIHINTYRDYFSLCKYEFTSFNVYKLHVKSFFYKKENLFLHLNMSRPVPDKRSVTQTPICFCNLQHIKIPM